MSNGIDVNGKKQVHFPTTGERIVARLKGGCEVHGMYQDRRIWVENCEIYYINQVESWRPDETAGR